MIDDPGSAPPDRLRVGSEAQGFDAEAPLFVISVAAQLAGMHAQTLRSYDREGLVSPGRSAGGGRRYSRHDIELLREVQRLRQDNGVNRAGIRRIIELESQVVALRSRLAEIQRENDALFDEVAALRTQASTVATMAASEAVAGLRRDLVPFTAPGNAVVRWRRG
jgi:MerR family transcriptional regulator/heat shock protein HspR